MENQQASTLGSTLIDAAKKGQVKNVRRLLDQGASVNYQNEHGWTSLLAAIYQNHWEAVRLLLDKGAAVNCQNDDGWTPLLWASWYGHGLPLVG
jgi:ankyrin repeat protein